VLGGPGTGKTRLLVEMAADRILRGGVDPEQLLVVTANRRAAIEVRAGITALLTAGSNELNPRTAREPLVRTVHSKVPSRKHLPHRQTTPELPHYQFSIEVLQGYPRFWRPWQL